MKTKLCTSQQLQGQLATWTITVRMDDTNKNANVMTVKVC